MDRSRASSVTWLVLPAIVIGLCQVDLAAGPTVAWLDFNGTIPGESTEEHHKDWIEIKGLGVDTTRTFTSGSGGSPIPSLPKVGEILLTKELDRASPPLFIAAAAGTQPYPLVKLDLNFGTGKPIARLELQSVLLGSQTFAAAAGTDTPKETISLNFSKITYFYLLPDARTAFTSYDMVKNKATSGFDSVVNPDTDSDGMPDAWESAYGLSAGTNDAAGDADGDGLSNLDEFQLGTHPKSGTSFFKATLSAVPATPGSYHLTWNSVVGKTYIIEWSPDLQTPFSPVRTVTAATTSSSETITSGGAVGFYRVRPQ
ncbi:type VI secretion system tube protein Hcp [Luteolibacter arcticus]|uniref:Type VI secretion system tube protein Hcp n=1 Tax=Luteolibacter arcticus TaxID=1581411 RepID=A0ABT3GE26_9BACT|nr:type VI secretion system tube protein Hcp [Luteolibacter arcticus]MCW1921863.1 type VI secretion system tube protein Hcp [Luteolibacter arcticus]